MRIDDGFQQRVWREPEDTDMRARHALAPETAPEAEAAPPFWAAGTPVPPNTLTALPPAQVATPAPSPAPASYVGEAPVDAAWLATRESALVAVRQDYEAARQQALASGGSGPGWQTAQVSTDESGQVSSLPGRTLVHVSDPNAQAVLVGYDEGGPVYQQPAGQWLEFNEEAFAAHYRAQGGAPLQQLAASYDTDAATLLARHPDIWTVATQDHAINAGPAPAGRAMGDASQLGMLDLYMADPQVAALIASYGGSVPPASSGVALEQVRVYGQARYEQLTKLGNAMQSVRDQYSDAMAHAQAHGGPGWTDRPRMVTVSDEGGATTTQPICITDESGQPLRGADGQPQLLTERVFDPDAFTTWYVQQGGQQHQAFASFYGQSHTQYSTDESGQTFASSIGFDNPSWSMWGVGGGMSHKELVRIDPNHAPRLNDNSAVGFDLETGWATHHSNIHQKRDWFETVVQVAIVAAVSYVSAGTLGPAVAGAVGVSSATGVAVVSAAVAGAAGSMAGGMLSGNLNFKDVLRGALAGGLSAGLTSGFGQVAYDIGGAAGTVALRTTVQGGIQALLGGSFKDGAIAGFASGLADVAGANMRVGIDKAVSDGTMGAAEAAAARTLARVVGSAIRAAGNPADPGYGFANAFLGDVIQQVGMPGPVTQTAFDDDGNLMPGIIDPGATPAEQQAQLAAHLERQGLDAGSATALAQNTIRQHTPGLMPLLMEALNDPRIADDRLITDGGHDQALGAVNAELGIDPEADPHLVPAGWVDDSVSGAAGYVSRLVGRAGGALGETVNKVMNAITIGRLEEAQQGIAAYLDGAAARGGLSEIEIMALGTLYAANEALFPTTALDVIPGAGKTLAKVGGLIRAGGNARELAAATRIESRAAADAERATQVNAAAVEARAINEGREVVRETRGQVGDWNSALSADLKPNAVYILDNGHSYFTDTAGRVMRADGTLDLGKVDRNTYQQVMAGHIGGDGYDGGHLIATLFGGAGEKINLVPQLSSVNRGEFRAMEKTWADALRDGKTVKVEVSPVYATGGSVPTELVARWWIDGVPAQRRFPNVQGG